MQNWTLWRKAKSKAGVPQRSKDKHQGRQGQGARAQGRGRRQEGGGRGLWV